MDKKTILAVALFLLLVGAVGANGSSMDGYGYIRIDDENSRTYYMGGLADGFDFSYGITELKWGRDCLAGKGREEIKTMVEKHMKDNPNEWESPMTTIFFHALVSQCPNAPAMPTTPVM